PVVVRRHLRLSLADGVSHSVMLGMGETYFAAFALAMGMSDLVSGLAGTIPMCVGGLVQLLAPVGLARVGSHRRWVVGCAALQALSFAPLVIGALLGRFSPLLLYACAALYWASGMATGPAWNIWIGRLVPAAIRARYFGFRQAAVQIGVLAGLASAGLWLHRATTTRVMEPALAFAVVFTVALLARGASTLLLAAHRDVPSPSPVREAASLRASFLRLGTRSYGRLVVFIAAVNASVWVGSAFYTPYLLRHRGYSYDQYMLLIAATFVSKGVALPLLGRVVGRLNPRRLLVIGGMGIAPLPVLWLATTGSFPGLLAVQLFGGVAWAAFELGSLLLFFDVEDELERTGVLTLFNGLNAVAIASGSIAGGVLLEAAPAHLVYVVVFLASAGLRLLSLILVTAVPERAWKLAVPALRILILGVRPTSGGVDEPVLPTMPPRRERTGSEASPPEDPARHG
ncbi:MAG TPA: MFS transporter, partial [Haliangium sp.]|nr:MFS transporter [Haliangium sp.]